VVVGYRSLSIVFNNVGRRIRPDNLNGASEPIFALPRIEQGDDEGESASDGRGVVHRLGRHGHSKNQVSLCQVLWRDKCLREREAEDNDEACNVRACNRHENCSNRVWHLEWPKFDILTFAQQMREDGS
jgi:hypothetical protein